MKYPKKWIEAFYESKVGHSEDDYAETVLSELKELGALKDPPKPSDFWICSACERVIEERTDTRWSCATCDLPMIHTREVIE